MSQRPLFYPFQGGLDLTSPALAVPKGRVIGCQNHESVSQGYARIEGFERYDGRLSPTEAFRLAATPEEAATDREAARAAIGPVPGSGPVRGVATFNGTRYAWRDNLAGTVGVLHKATEDGWEPVWAMFPAGGRYYTVNHNFYGATNLKRLYGCNGVGKAFEFDGDTTLTFIDTGMASDTPNRIAAFKQHLFLSFPGGSVQHSETGVPTAFSAVLGAGEIAVGADVTDFATSVNALHIFTTDSINNLLGSDATDWVMEPLTDEEGTGALAHTVQKLATPLYMDVGGLRSIAATTAYGNFKIGSLIDQISPIIEAKRTIGVKPIASVVVKDKGQYRLFFEDGTGFSVFFGRKYAEPMLFDLGKKVTCISSAEDPEAGSRMFFGSDDGYVYELDAGTSFDGGEIEAFLQLPYDPSGSPWQLKRWHKIILELRAKPNTEIGMTAEFDYSDGDQRTLPTQSFAVNGGGGLWDLANWDQFFWSAAVEGRAECYLDGQGSNMSLVIVSRSAEQEAYVLSGITMMISGRGQKR